MCFILSHFFFYLLVWNAVFLSCLFEFLCVDIFFETVLFCIKVLTGQVILLDTWLEPKREDKAKGVEKQLLICMFYPFSQFFFFLFVWQRCFVVCVFEFFSLICFCTVLFEFTLSLFATGLLTTPEPMDII